MSDDTPDKPNVISFDAMRRRKVEKKQSQTVISFPRIFRVKGYIVDLDEDGNEIVTDEEVITYSLVPDDTCGLAKSTVEHIEKFDPAIDSGWLIIRLHRSEEAIAGYAESIADINMVLQADVRMSGYVVDDLYFSSYHIPAMPNAPDHVIMLVTCVPVTLNGQTEEADVYRILLPDGTELTDPELLFECRANNDDESK